MRTEHQQRTVDLIDQFTEALASDDFVGFFERLAANLMRLEQEAARG